MLPRVFLFALIVTSTLSAQTPAPTTQTAPPPGYTAILPLWPAGAIPLGHGAGNTSDGDIPKLFTYPAPGPGPHPAVIVMPGGGYTHLAIEKEGSAPAQFLNAHGVSAFVLEYRLAPAYNFPAPMLDATRAIRYIRANAAALGVDPNKLGVWGFSAGGHLSGYLSSVHNSAADSPDPIDHQSARPDFAVLAYGRFDLSAALPRPAPTPAAPGMEIVLNAKPGDIDIIPLISADNPPAFLYSTSGDQTVDSRNSTAYYNAMKRLNLPAELHIFDLGPHGTGLAQPPAQTPAELAIWPTLLSHWMQQNHWMPVP